MKTMRAVDEKDWNEIGRVLLHCIGDHRLCPECGQGFLPRDLTAKRAEALYERLFNKEGV